MNSEPERAARALSFGGAAEDYDRYRPGYPPEAVAWATPVTPGRVVDLGAGTGILTRALAAAGHDVLPIEPDQGMRAQMTRSTPGVGAIAGSAEEIPITDSSVDGVVAGQAYHWFEPESAHREIARILRPGGIFATLWNIRDDSVAWVGELTAIADGARGYRGGGRPCARFVRPALRTGGTGRVPARGSAHRGHPRRADPDPVLLPDRDSRRPGRRGTVRARPGREAPAGSRRVRAAVRHGRIPGTPDLDVLPAVAGLA
jgi:SAM-dependent methyltransferase